MEGVEGRRAVGWCRRGGIRWRCPRRTPATLTLPTPDTRNPRWARLGAIGIGAIGIGAIGIGAIIRGSWSHLRGGAPARAVRVWHRLLRFQVDEGPK